MPPFANRLKKLAVVPLRPVGPVGDADGEIAHDLDVVAGAPTDRSADSDRPTARGSARRSTSRAISACGVFSLVADLHRQRRDARSDEAVLIAADEAVALRFRIGLHRRSRPPSPWRGRRCPDPTRRGRAPSASSAGTAAGTCRCSCWRRCSRAAPSGARRNSAIRAAPSLRR